MSIKIKDINHLIGIITQNLDPFVFRGISSINYNLHSKLERCFHTANLPYEQWKDAESAAIVFFQKKYQLLNKKNTPLEDDIFSWLCLMQHYGAPTRLMDWTHNLAVACFFAYSNAPISSDGSAVIWGINTWILQSVFPSQYGPGDNYMGTLRQTIFNQDGEQISSFLRPPILTENIIKEYNHYIRHMIADDINHPFFFDILKPDLRMAAQEGCFTMSGKLFKADCDTTIELMYANSTPNLFEDETNSFFSNERLRLEKYKEAHTFLPSPMQWVDNTESNLRLQIDDASSWIARIELPYSLRNEALVVLNRLGITHDRLFPTVDGIGKATELFIQHGI